MALTNDEREKILDALERMDDATKILVIASIEAFTNWLSNVLYLIYVKVKDSLGKIWNWIKSQF